jgi:hypothetical protein
LCVGNKRGKVFSGFKRNLEEDAAADSHAKPARRKPPAYLLASELKAAPSHGHQVRGHGPADPFATVGAAGGLGRNVPSFIRSQGGHGVASSGAASDFSGRTMNTAMLASSSHNDSLAGTSSGQP